MTANEGKKPQRVAIAGDGAEIIGNEALLNRAKRKTIWHPMILSLIDVAKGKRHRACAIILEGLPMPKEAYTS